MVAAARGYLRDSLAVTTHASYATAVKSYLAFCDAHSYPYARAWPAQWDTVCLWMSWLAPRVRPSTVRKYVTALNTAHELAGQPMPTRGQDHPLVERLFRGIKRRHEQQAQSSKRRRLPIDTELLRRIRTVLPLATDSNARMLYAAMCTGTCALLRCAEFAHDASKSHYRVLQLGDLSLVCSDGATRLAHTVAGSGGALPAGVRVRHARLFLAASKTDPFRQGVSVLLAAPLALQALRRYLRAHPCPALPTAPLFAWAPSGLPLTNSDLVSCMRTCIAQLGLPPGDYAGHSFRKGGATSLAAAGAPHHLIQALGRWSSDCYRLYIDMPIDSIAAAARRM